MPIGGYVPAFEKRILEPPVVVLNESVNQPEARRPLVLMIPWILAAVFAGIAVFLWIRSLNVAPKPHPEFVSQSVRRFWTQIFSGKGEDVLLVIGDSGFALWQDLKRENLTLADYLSARFRAPENAPDMSEVASRRYSSLADVNFVTRLLPLSQNLGSRVRVRFARNIDIRDLKTGNIILLGSRRANPWAELFEPHLHHAYGYDVEARRSFFRNISPRPGEPEILARNNNGASKGESYGLVALLPNLNASGKVLLIEGLNMEGTDAAGDFLMNANTCEMLIRHLESDIGFPDRYFEALLKLTPLAGSSANVQLVSVRRPAL